MQRLGSICRQNVGAVSNVLTAITYVSIRLLPYYQYVKTSNIELVAVVNLQLARWFLGVFVVHYYTNNCAGKLKRYGWKKYGKFNNYNIKRGTKSNKANCTWHWYDRFGVDLLLVSRASKRSSEKEGSSLFARFTRTEIEDGILTKDRKREVLYGNERKKDAVSTN